LLTDYLATGGEFGEVPVWYKLIRAAKYLQVPVWDLAAQNSFWMKAALEAEVAEGKANKWQLKRRS